MVRAAYSAVRSDTGPAATPLTLDPVIGWNLSVITG
jgi:hypothetical protein